MAVVENVVLITEAKRAARKKCEILVYWLSQVRDPRRSLEVFPPKTYRKFATFNRQWINGNDSKYGHPLLSKSPTTIFQSAVIWTGINYVWCCSQNIETLGCECMWKQTYFMEEWQITYLRRSSWCSFNRWTEPFSYKHSHQIVC